MDVPRPVSLPTHTTLHGAGQVVPPVCGPRLIEERAMDCDVKLIALIVTRRELVDRQWCGERSASDWKKWRAREIPKVIALVNEVRQAEEVLKDVSEDGVPEAPGGAT